MTNPLRGGIIGTGNICYHGHLPAYALLDQFELVALFDTDHNAAQRAQDRYNALISTQHGKCSKESVAKICASSEELMERVDVVDICTSLRYHAYYSAMAL